MRKDSSYRFVCVFVFCIAIMAARSARSELIAYDQFYDYANGQLTGQGQGVGWAGNWGGSTNFTVSGGDDLNYGGLETYGGGANSGTSIDQVWRQITRTLATPITNSGTYYLGFLLQPSKSGSSYSRHAGIRLDAADSDNFRIGAGIWDNLGNWALRRKDGGGAGQGYGNESTSISRTTNITYFVIKFVFNTDGDESADMYVNPADAIALASAGDANYSFGSQCPDISKIVVVRYQQSGQIGNMAFDEIRLGTEAEDMFGPIFRPPSGTVLIIR